MDTITGRNSRGAILTLTERSTNFILMEKPGHGKEAAHGKITEAMKETSVYFTDSCCS